MFISTIIPTIGRATLAKAVHSVLEQKFRHGACEVIVVNDSGRDLPEEGWQKHPNVRILSTNRLNRSIARNTGAAVATGRYFHFLDDDDWMMPGAFETLLDVARKNRAGWVYGAFRLVDNSGTTVTEIRPDDTGNCSIQMMAWEWLPLQASLILSDAFWKVDGFASLPSLGGGFEDVHIARQVSLFYDMSYTDRIVTSIRIGEVSSTTNYITMFDQNRHSREKTIAAPQAFGRLLDSAKANTVRPDYWFGKVIYYYLASLKWNLQSRHFLTAASRGTRAIAALALAGPRMLKPEFWRGVIQHYHPRMGRAIQEAGADHLYASTRQAIELVNSKSKR